MGVATIVVDDRTSGTANGLVRSQSQISIFFKSSFLYLFVSHFGRLGAFCTLYCYVVGKLITLQQLDERLSEEQSHPNNTFLSVIIYNHL
jgi:hypothetical protein